jgi:GTPase SAR1 family protein
MCILAASSLKVRPCRASPPQTLIRHYLATVLVYEPTVFENHVKTVFVDEQEVDLSLWDTAGAKSSPLARRYLSA